MAYDPEKTFIKKNVFPSRGAKRNTLTKTLNRELKRDFIASVHGRRNSLCQDSVNWSDMISRKQNSRDAKLVRRIIPPLSLEVVNNESVFQEALQHFEKIKEDDDSKKKESPSRSPRDRLNKSLFISHGVAGGVTLASML